MTSNRYPSRARKLTVDPLSVESFASPIQVTRSSRNGAPGPRRGPAETDALAAGASPFSLTDAWPPTWELFQTMPIPPPALAQSNHRLANSFLHEKESSTGR